MRFRETPLPGSFLIELEPHHDERGFFARTFCEREFRDHGLDPCVAQCNVSYNHRRGTLRGMHLQLPPHEEDRLVRCTAGSIYDVIVDVRDGSPTRGRWFAATLSAAERIQLYVPRGFVHGFLTLEEDVEVSYQMSAPYAAGSAAGYRYDDPTLAIEWPFPPAVISQRDLDLPWFT
ncbi:MAG TPA: dTDP-4-dehydrorhamnose 3,5-epimerase family protein [Thermoanaerobaculia bacterium]|nr:dTDP-4-dehydrorhamnose 3,5-epimerase family protein [Thermoanaerobaculia bacterium]